MHFTQQFCPSFVHTTSHRETHRLTIAIAITFALTLVFPQSTHAQSSQAGGRSASLTTQDATQRARAFPHLKLGDGRELEYLGMFQPDGKFRKTSRVTRFLESRSVTVPETPDQQAARQSAAPLWMLSSNVRLVDDIEPPKHAMALPETHSTPAEVRNAVVSFVYGRLRVLGAPQHLTTDSQQRIIISDPGIPAIHVFDSKGKTSFSILGGKGRRLQLPVGVAVDKDDNIYVADSERGLVLVYNPYGQFLRYIGDFHGEGMYQGARGIAIDREAGHLYLVDSPRHLVLLLDLKGNLLEQTGPQWADSAGFELKRRDNTAPRAFNYPTEIALNDDGVAVLDTAGTRVQKMDLECNLLAGFSVANPSRQQIDREDGLAVDSDGNIYISRVGTSEVRVFSQEGRLVASFGEAGSRAGEFSGPRGLWLDVSNRLYVSDTANARVQLFQLTGVSESDWVTETGK